MKTFVQICFLICLTSLLVHSPVSAGKGYMGGQGNIVVEEPPPITPTEPVTDTQPSSEPTDTTGVPDSVTGPLNDKMADSGKLFGDLYTIIRHQGILNDKKLVPSVTATGEPELTYDIPGFEKGIQLFTVATNSTTTPDAVIGGEPILTVVDAETYDTSNLTNFSDYGWYSAEIGTNPDGTPIYGARQSPYPAQCVQPVASYERWGDISSKTHLTKNRLPMVVTYDATWGRSECNVGQLAGEVVADPVTGALTIPTNFYFIQPCYNIDGTPIDNADCTWKDPTNGVVTYPVGVLWSELVGEVQFGRLNLSRSPEAVLQAAFDEVINNLNSKDTIGIKIDASGRLLLTKNVYDEILVDTETGLPKWIGTTEKAIDSPLENVALYVKLMQDGHLVTPADERIPIDRSKNGGIPIWKMLELSDGPATAALRPTIDISKLKDSGLGSLVDVTPVTYLTYYQCLDSSGSATPCLCWNEDPVQPELERELVTCSNVVNRALFSTTDSCPMSTDPDNPIVCEGPFYGIETDGAYTPDASDLNFTAAFLAAAADKTGDLSVDMVVYLNSILGINKVIGYSSYTADGTPSPDAIDYSKNPKYFNYKLFSGYNRKEIFSRRGPQSNGNITVLQGTSPGWTETSTYILTATIDNSSIFDNIGLDMATWFPNEASAVENILGFTQLADDNLGVTNFTHTFQIPGLR